MKKRILVMMHYLELGGAETSLIGLLNAFNPKVVDVDLFIYDHRGPLMKFIPPYVNLLPLIPSYSVIEQPLKTALKQFQFGVTTGRILARIKHALYRKKTRLNSDSPDASIFQYIGNNVQPFLPKINPDVSYDLCISYLTPHNFALSKVKASKRIAWIHTDYSTIHINKKIELPVWNKFDYIVSISRDVTNSFLKTFPELESKIIEIENILPQSMIKERAEETEDKDLESFKMAECLKLLSIGRFTDAKNYDNVPDIAARIVKKGIKDFKWYIIGFGADEELIRKNIILAEMQDHVILLGRKDNPYPFIKACDIYLQPSRYEGKSITVREAQILGKPIVVTNYPTAHSQINDGVDGIIVPMDNEHCAEAITGFIRDLKKIQLLKNNIENSDFSGKNEVNKIYSLLDA